MTRRKRRDAKERIREANVPTSELRKKVDCHSFRRKELYMVKCGSLI